MPASALLSRQPHHPGPALTLMDQVTLPRARAHEICGPARHMLALLVAGAMSGPVFWIAPSWQREAVNPEGMLALAAPERFTFISVRRPEDLLWTLEEVLRSGAVPLAGAELPEPPAMTPVRRLHLAAETGAQAGIAPPLGVILTPGEGGAPGIETRWHMAQAHRPGAASWHLSRRRARTAPPRNWHLTGGPGDWALQDLTHGTLAPR